MTGPVVTGPVVTGPVVTGPVVPIRTTNGRATNGRTTNGRATNGRATKGRDPFVDVVRAYAVVGVVLGHWMVTGLVLGADGALRQASPLSAMPHLAPATWVLQTLGLFFFAGGFAAARSSRRAAGYRAWLRRHLARLPGPVGVLLGTWAVALLIAAALGAPAATLRTVGTLAVSPLWFLLPYVALVAATGLLRRAGLVALVPAVAVVAVGDLASAGHLTAAPPVAVQVLAAWAVPWIFGIAAADGRLPRPSVIRPAVLLLVGVAATAVLIGWAGYPASAVGVPGDGRSNLSPPSLVAVALAVAQIGAVLLLREWLSGTPDRVISTVHRLALPIFLGHQSVLLAVAVTAARLHPSSPASGLLTAPTDPVWLAHRAAWLPVLALLLAAVLAVVAARATPGRPGTRHERMGGTISDGRGPVHNRRR